MQYDFDTIVAIHETGHCVVGMTLGFAIRFVSIEQDKIGPVACGLCALAEEIESAPATIHGIVKAAGITAVELAYPGGSAWLHEQQTRRPIYADIQNISRRLGITPQELLPHENAKSDDVGTRRLGFTTHAQFVGLCCDAVDILLGNWPVVLQVADELMQRKTLSGAEVRRIVCRCGRRDLIDGPRCRLPKSVETAA